MQKIIVTLLAVTAFGGSLEAQLPQINGVGNSASWGGLVAPGSLVSIFGTNLADAPHFGTPPYQTMLGGTSMSINGTLAPLLYVSQSQINLQLPSSTGVSGTALTAIGNAMVTTAAGSSASFTINVTPAYPGLFTANGSGCGQAAAQVIHPDGATSFNSPFNSAAPGDYIALYGTGFGVAVTQPADGAPSPATPLKSVPGILLDQSLGATPLYAGLAPGLTGVDQINFQVPANIRNGCAVPLTASQTFASPTVTLSIQSGRGQCTDPPITSWGQVTLSKATFYGPTTANLSTTEAFSASFPSGPAVQASAPEQVVFAPNFVANSNAIGARLIAVAQPLPANAFPTCTIPGYSHLSAGMIQIQPPSGTAVIAPPFVLPDGVTYNQTLPTGFIAPGDYKVSGSPGSPVSLQTTIHVGSPIQVQTTFPPGTVISESQPLSVKWTGGDAGTLVRVALISQASSGTQTESYSYADASAGSLTFGPACVGNPVPAGSGVFCTLGVPQSTIAQVQVQVLPNPASLPTASVPGVTGPVQLSWSYSYDFSGLSIGP